MGLPSLIAVQNNSFSEWHPCQRDRDHSQALGRPLEPMPGLPRTQCGDHNSASCHWNGASSSHQCSAAAAFHAAAGKRTIRTKLSTDAHGPGGLLVAAARWADSCSIGHRPILIVPCLHLGACLCQLIYARGRVVQGLQGHTNPLGILDDVRNDVNHLDPRCSMSMLTARQYSSSVQKISAIQSNRDGPQATGYLGQRRSCGEAKNGWTGAHECKRKSKETHIQQNGELLAAEGRAD